MLSLFKRNASGRPSHTARKKSDGSASLSSKRDGIMEKKVLEGADRELYRYDQPEQELGMSDIVKNHEPGTRFMYAAITGRESEDINSKLRRLISYQPALRKKAVPVDNLPVIKLFRESETFPLDQVLPKSTKKSQSYGDYVRVSDAVTLYGAVVSPDCNFTKVQVGISDNRLLTDKMVKSFTATTNLMTKGNLALPYCVPVADADQLVLTVSRERAFLEEGRQWGAIQIQLIMEFSNFPTQFDNQPVAAVNMLPSTALETPLNNPNNIDISVLNQDRKKLAELYLDGDLADENEPIENKTAAVRYAKSSISGAQKGKQLQSATPEWSFIKDKRTMVDADQNSIEPEVDDLNGSISDRESIEDIARPATPPRKSALKKPSETQNDRPNEDGPSDSPPKGVKFHGDIKRITPF